MTSRLGQRVVYVGPSRRESQFHRNGIRGTIMYGQRDRWYVLWDRESFTATSPYRDSELADAKLAPMTAALKSGGPCTYCGIFVPFGERTVDHEPPRSIARRTAKHPVYRRLLACGPCNGLKAARTEAQFRRWLLTDRGVAWIALRAQEAASGTESPERAEFVGAPGNARRRGEQRARTKKKRTKSSGRLCNKPGCPTCRPEREARADEEIRQQQARDPDKERWSE